MMNFALNAKLHKIEDEIEINIENVAFPY